MHVSELLVNILILPAQRDEEYEDRYVLRSPSVKTAAAFPLSIESPLPLNPDGRALRKSLILCMPSVHERSSIRGATFPGVW